MINKKFIQNIRDEANDVKACFTTFSFQAIAFSGVILSAISAYQPDQPLLGFASILVIVVVIAVAKIGDYKYATANRNAGFELYLETIYSQYLMRSQYDLKLDYGWEEILRVWRVVQATVFNKLYHTNPLFCPGHVIKYNRLKNIYLKPEQFCEKNEQCKNCDSNPKCKTKHWFNPDDLVAPYASWYPGKYLFRMHGILHFIAWISVLPLVAMAVQIEIKTDVLTIFPQRLCYNIFSLRYVTIFLIFFIIVTVYFLASQMGHINARRGLLERGLLSIHSCSIMWQVIVKVHQLARTGRDGHIRNQKEYLIEVAKHAQKIENNLPDIYKWLNEP